MDPMITRQVVSIVAAYVTHHQVGIYEMPALIATVYESLAQIASSSLSGAIALEPAVPVRKSITADYIICLEDGVHLKMLKRHLKNIYNLTPDEYRSRWGLPSDYPMVAPNYAKRRSALARRHGLGRKVPGSDDDGDTTRQLVAAP